MRLITEQRIQLFDRNICPLFIHNEVHKFPCTARVVFLPKISRQVFVSDGLIVFLSPFVFHFFERWMKRYAEERQRQLNQRLHEGV